MLHKRALPPAQEKPGTPLEPRSLLTRSPWGLCLLLGELLFFSSSLFASEEHGGGGLLLFFAWANFLLFIVLAYFLARKPFREFLGYRRLTLTRTLKEQEEREEALRARLAQLTREAQGLAEEFSRKRQEAEEELRRECELLRKEFEAEKEKLRRAYEIRFRILAREKEQELFRALLYALREELIRELKKVPAEELLRRYLRRLPLGKS